MYYFAYGSNMLSNRLESRLGTVQDLGIATLSGYKIAFNKVSSDGTGKTSIVPFENETVIGVVFRLTNEQFITLDQSEGGYNRVSISIRMDDNVIETETYIAKANRINNMLLPTREYRQYLIDGATEHGFPNFYIDMLTHINIVD